MEVVKGHKNILGECNFCNRTHYYIIYELRGKSTSVRICNKCLKEAREVI